MSALKASLHKQLHKVGVHKLEVDALLALAWHLYNMYLTQNSVFKLVGVGCMFLPLVHTDAAFSFVTVLQ